MDTFNPQSIDSKISEILTKIAAIEDKGDNRQIILTSIKEQVSKTNGRVTALETPAEINKWWIGFLTGVVIAICSFLAIKH